MKTKTMSLDVDMASIDGSASSREGLHLVIEEYRQDGRGGVAKRVKIPLHPNMIEYLAMKLWDAHDLHAKSVKMMSDQLKRV